MNQAIKRLEEHQVLRQIKLQHSSERVEKY